MVRGWAARQPDVDAVTVAETHRLTYGELDEQSSRFAQALLAAGVSRGDRVAFLGRRATTWAVVLAGASKVRAAGTPLNWRLTGGELGDVVADADPAVIVCEPSFLTALDPALEQATRLSGSTPMVITRGAAVTELDAWLAPVAADDPGAQCAADDIAFLFYTSGTTGRPKGVEVSNGNVAANLALPTPWTICPDDVVLVPAPLFHISGSGWLYQSLCFGASALFVNELTPAELLRLFESERVAVALVVPALLQMLVRDPVAAEVDFSALRTLVYGGSPISSTVLAEARAVFGTDLAQGYGMTEAGVVSILGPDDHRPGAPEHRLLSAGRPRRGVEVQIVEPSSGVVAPPGEVGEVWTRSDQNMVGYRNRPDETAATLTADGWLRTGDAGYFDNDGYLYLTDRLNDMIVSGGENVYPAEVENALMSHPDVGDAAVIGVPDEKWGETVKAVVVLRPGHTVEAEELIGLCRQRLAHYKCPTSVDVVDTLPRNANGKILKRQLRERYWADAIRRIN